MCGICGLINGNNPEQKRLLAVLNVSRGEDGVGMYYDKKRLRIPDSITAAMRAGRIPGDAWTSKIFLCHTRRKSPFVGGRTKKNTHPFRCGDIIGAHNGYISNWKELKRKYKDEFPEVEEFDVDSEMVFFLVSKKGWPSLKELEGVAAAWWVDVGRPNEVFLWSSRKELSVQEQDDLIAFSSDGDHLLMAGFDKKKKWKVKDCGTVLKIDADALKIETLGKAETKRESCTRTTTYRHSDFRGSTGDSGGVRMGRSSWRGAGEYRTKNIEDEMIGQGFVRCEDGVWRNQGGTKSAKESAESFSVSCSDYRYEHEDIIDNAEEEFWSKTACETLEDRAKVMIIVKRFSLGLPINYCDKCGEFITDVDFSMLGKPIVRVSGRYACPHCKTTCTIATKKEVETTVFFRYKVDLQKKSLVADDLEE